MLFSFHIEWKWPLEDEGTVKNCEIGIKPDVSPVQLDKMEVLK
jgi:hypothetical protein